jgi:hypothetical protein
MDPLHMPILEEWSAPAPDDSDPTNKPPTTAAALDNISISTVTPKLAGSPVLINSNPMKPGV